MNALKCYLFALSVIVAPIHGKPQLSNREAIIVEANSDATAYAEGTGRNLFPIGTTSDKIADFRLPIAEIVPKELIDEARLPRLINGPPPTESEDDLAVVIVGSTNDESDSEEGRSLPLDDGRRSPLVVDFEIIGASNTDYDEDDFVVIAAVHDECLEELDAGSGDDAIDSYYYDSNENRCFFFWYAGTGGNGNRFSTEEECENKCKKIASKSNDRVCSTAAPTSCEEGCPLIKDASDGCLKCSCDGINQEVCNEEGGKTGVCKGTFPYWYFEKSTQTCEPFVYGGCEAGSSSNKFKTKALCQKTCSKPQGSIEVVSPKNLELSEENNENSNKSNICLEEGGKRGLCNGALTFWFFNQNTNACESFIYGGCEAGSSQNKFVTKEVCEQTCGN